MKVLIVGGGFAGVKLARNLAGDSRFEVTLISDRDHFEYHAALYRSATGRSHLEVSVPLSEIFPAGSGVTVIQDRITGLNDKRHEVEGASGKKYKYDTLALALGVVTEFFGIKGLAEHSYGIKSIDEATRLKNHLHDELRHGHPDADFVIVGGGATGVELAGEMVAYLRQLRRAHRVRSTKFTVHLVEAAPRILPALPEEFAAKVTKRLKRIGVRVHTGVAVQKETKDKLMLPGGETIQTHMVVWTAGIANNPFYVNNPIFKLGKGKRVMVGPDLSAAPNIYVLGDSTAMKQSGWAQTALYDADFVAHNLKAKLDDKPLRKYEPHPSVAAIPVGPKWCGVAQGKKRSYGYQGWLVRRWLDRKLFTRLLPAKLASRTWWYGTRREETCPECARFFGLKPGK